MNFQRIPYTSMTQVETEKVQTPGGQTFTVPCFSYPVTPQENFRRMNQGEQPLWVPTSLTDFHYITADQFLAEAETGFAKKNNPEDKTPSKMLYLDMGPGPIQMQELFSHIPEAPTLSAEAMAEMLCAKLDKVLSLTKVDLVLYRDDWSEAANAADRGEDILSMPEAEAAGIFFRHAQSRGIPVTFRCKCLTEQMVDQVVQLRPDYLQLTGDLRYFFDYRDRFGDFMGMDVVLDGQTEEETVERMRYAVEQFAFQGRMIATVGLVSEEGLWAGLQELYCYSRECYQDPEDFKVKLDEILKGHSHHHDH
ncbi:MAG: hypothetical protein Q4B85_01905 [Lachnospiraceae bacterium]|nr:hypothetical protein [Lachnospiraceae bacterium]